MQTALPLEDQIAGTATFSDCQRYRYSLQRVWSRKQNQVLVIGLNPSTADATLNDPTIRRCIRFAQSWGCGSLVMANLFAYRATDPSRLQQVDDPVGPDNDAWLIRLADQADRVVAAWGNHGTYLNRAAQVLELIDRPEVLKLNQSGQPAHPLYLKHDLKPKPWV